MCNYIAVIIICIVIFILLHVYYFFRNKETFDNITNYQVTKPNKNKNIVNIPKIIWTYWHDLSNVPHVVTKCINTWIINNEDYIINILDDDRFEKLTEINIDQVFSITDNKIHQKKSDYIRLVVVYLYGGIWLDASTICEESLDWVLKLQNKGNYEFIGYVSPDTDHNPVLDNWFLAAIPKSVFIYDWLMEFTKVLSYDKEKDYSDEQVSKYTIPQNIVQMLPYFNAYLCNWVVMHKNPGKYRIFMEPSTLPGNPLYYVHKNIWNYDSTVNDIRNNPIVYTKVFKIIGPLRDHIIKHNDKYETSDKHINYVFDNRY